MKSITKLSVILCAAACMAWPVQAQTATPPATNTTPATPAAPRARLVSVYRGTVASIDAAAMTLTVKGRSNEFKVKITSTTKILKDNVPSQFSDITAGLRVTGQGKRSESGDWTATTVRATAATRPKAPAAAKPQ